MLFNSIEYVILEECRYFNAGSIQKLADWQFGAEKK